jgi:ElaB/YqjD/DUF883 family membrane-anchored ribosome-binding protein
MANSRTDKHDLSTSTQRLRDDLHSTGQTMRDEFGTLAQDARTIAIDAGKAARRSVEPFESYIRDNPLRSACIAAGIGILLGMFWKKR